MTSTQLRARYWRIVLFFARVTASFIFWEIVLRRIGLGALAAPGRTKRYRGYAIRFRALALHLSGLMIKVGQFLSARLDVLPPEITDELSGLQDEVPAESYEAIREAAEADLHEPLASRYAWVDETPMAAASLGQVHRARLRPEDAAACGFAEVVVKVQRPYIEQIVDTDLAALRRVGAWLQHYEPVRKRTNVPALVEEFAATTMQEIDYLAEGRNAETFATNFAENPRIHVPRVAWPLTSRRVLTLENVSAIKLSDYDAITAAGIDRGEVARVLLDTYMQQILEDGFFHADPHPGNLFVTPMPRAARVGAAAEQTASADSEAAADAAAEPDAAPTPLEWELTFVDFGMVGRVPENLREGLRDGLIAIGTQDAPRLVEAYKTLGVLLPTADTRLIEMASRQLFDRFWGLSMADLKNIDHAELMRFSLQFRELIVDLPFQLPENLLLLGRTIAILSGMCTGLDPEFNLWTSIAPYTNKLISQEGGSTLQTFFAEATKTLQTIVGLPGRTDRVLTILERGELNTQNPRLEWQTRRVAQSVNRLGGSIVFAALLLAGAILHPSDPGLARWLMGGSVLPLGWVLLGGRGHGPGR
jgi:predicted unusual protein kinase regulating ubiquinone biosynthesis (AarF/ABC1/UbiB family)